MFNNERYLDMSCAIYEGEFDSDHEQQYNRDVIASIISRGVEAKHNIISDLLSKMDGWNVGDYRVKFEYTEAIEPQWSTVIDNLYYIASYLDDGTPNRPLHVIKRLFECEEIRRLTIDNLWREIFLTLGYKVGVGMKIGRAINVIMLDMIDRFKAGDNSESYKASRIQSINQFYAAMSDALQSKEVKRTGYLSVNPYDFFRMSIGNSWDSCHKPNGAYASGAQSYLQDGITGLSYMENSKGELIFRSTVFFCGNRILFGRVYGDINLNKQLEKVISEAVAIATGVEFDRYDNSTSVPYRNADGKSHYDDHTTWSNRTYWFKDEIHVYDSNERIGGKAICIVCGEEHRGCELICESCNSMRSCEHCGARYSVDDMLYVDGYGYCCDDCSSICQRCGEAHLNRDMTETVDGMTCDSCLDYYVECELCNDLIHFEDSISIEDEDTGYTEYRCMSCS